MAWQDRLKGKIVYESPSGVRISFDYDDLSREFSKLTSGFNFPGVNGTFVQDLGSTGSRYPLRLFIWGNDYDLEAQRFEDALRETGIGRLEHPLYGVVNVVPFGDVKQRDDLKTAANQAVFEVTFWETVLILFPTGSVSPSSEVKASVSEYNEVAAESFKSQFELISAIQSVGLKNRFRRVLQLIRSFAQAAAAPRNEVLREFNFIYNSIDRSLDVLVTSFPTSGGSSPSAQSEAIENLGLLAGQTALLVQKPADAVSADPDRQLDYYESFINSIADDPDTIREPGLDSEGSNAFHVDDFFMQTAVTGAVLSVVNAQFETKTQAIQAADRVLALFDTVNTWRDANYESLNDLDFSELRVSVDSLFAIIDTGESYQQLQSTVALATGFLVEISFSLKQERRFILTRNRTIIDLVAELYGRLDEELDFFIASNNLNGDEILELPKGREIVYYR